MELKTVIILYGSMLHFVISLWGVVILLILEIICKIQAVALFEDIHIDKKAQINVNVACPGPGPNGRAFSLREDNVTDGYDNAAWSCFGAAFLYACFLVLSTVLIVYY
ncbi:uncharacterized protein [Dysidea avara]|uniref:uncharacterized protein n=1 Tax=Dysidea avara TaxID=196820 RepID=UPI00331BCA07